MRSIPHRVSLFVNSRGFGRRSTADQAGAKPLLQNASSNTSGLVLNDVGEGGCIALIASRGQFACLTISLPGCIDFNGGASVIYAVVVDLCFSMVQFAPLNKSVLHDANTDAPVAVVFNLVANHNSFNRCRSSFNWSIDQTDHETNRRRKLHASRHAQINT